MRRSVVLLSPVVLAVLLTPGLSTRTAADVGVYHLQDTEVFGTAGQDTLVDIATGGSDIASTGVVHGALPGQTADGGADVFVRVDWVDFFPELGPFHEQWTSQFGTSADDEPTSVAGDGLEVVAGGWTEGDLAGTSAGGRDGWVWSRDYDDEIWSTQIGGPDDDAVLDVEVSGRSDVFVAGNIGDQGFVRKYDPLHALEWEGEVSGQAVTHLVPIMGGDPVYPSAQLLIAVVQLPPGTPGGPDRTQVTALDVETGEELWSAPPSAQVVSAITADADRAYVAGTVGGATPHAVVTAYDRRTGAKDWTVDVLDGLPAGSAASWVTGAAWDSRWVATTVRVDGEDSDTLVAITPSGRRAWVRPLPAGIATTAAAAYDDDYPFAANALFVGGTVTGAGGDTDVTLTWHVVWQPDAIASRPRGRKTFGDDRYRRSGQRMVVPVDGTRTARVWLIAENDGDENQALRITSCASHNGYRITYDRHAADVTHLVTGEGYLTGRVGPNESGYVDMAITPRRRTTGPTTCRFTVTSPTTGERDRFTIAIKRH